MTLCILGRQPAISLAELEAHFGATALQPVTKTAVIVDTPELPISKFGGLMKSAKLVKSGLKTDRELLSVLLAALPAEAESKITVGLSWYDSKRSVKSAFALALELKKLARQELKLALRIVPNKTLELSTAQVIHNQLAQAPNIEFLLVEQNGAITVAQTSGIQDIEQYTKRDHGRPARDARVGMLPPKLAQVMLNLAIGQIEQKQEAGSKQQDQSDQGSDGKRQSGADEMHETTINNQNNQGLDEYKEDSSSGMSGTEKVPRMSSAESDAVVAKSIGSDTGSASVQANAVLTVLDPFCGTGVVLQEALLMGYRAQGSDLEARMVKMSQTNLEWLEQNWELEPGAWSLEVGDAQKLKWEPPIDAVVSEIYLGPPLSSPPGPNKLREIKSQVDSLLTGTLKNLAGQITAGTPLCLAVPAWRLGNNRFEHLSSIDRLEELGYTRASFKQASNQDLVYFRPDQIVARELLVLIKS